MRLLSFDAKGTLTVTDFSGKPIPPYAILSHRWGPNEVLFEHVKDGSYESQAGYQKIMFCAKQAELDNLRYFWCDTCCINKYNLRELSRSINSMYNWYQNAAQCYVFMADVSTSTKAEASQQCTWEKSFEASQWFTRGWTLQELIAPKTATFFSSEGHRLGDKVALERLICNVTRIPAKALHGCPLEEFSIAERKSWAESRVTTEPEDSAYCLLGILNIFMPATYGEGKDRALQRLQDEVDSVTTAPSVIPFSRNERSVSDEQQLAELQAKLFPNADSTTALAIIGPSGVGKSHLALELAYVARDKGTMVLWVNATSAESLLQTYRDVAHKLNLPGWNDSKQDVRRLVRARLEETTSVDWLVVFDNLNYGIRHPHECSKFLHGYLDDYLPQRGRGSIILTTTRKELVVNVPEDNIVTLQHVTKDVAEQIFESQLGCPVLASERPELKLLVKELLFLPLAIVQAASCIRVQNLSVEVYRAQLTSETHTFYAKVEESPDSGEEPVTEEPVTMTLLVSLHYIRQDHPSAAERLFLAACQDQKDILLESLEMSSASDLRNAIDTLHDYALITRRPADSSIDVHPITHNAVRDWLHYQQMLLGWVKTTVSELYRLFPDPMRLENRSKWRRLLPHANAVNAFKVPSRQDPERIQLLFKMAIALRNEGKLTEAVTLCKMVVGATAELVGPNNSLTLSVWRHLARMSVMAGETPTAQWIYKSLLDVYSRSLGAESYEVIRISVEMIDLYIAEGRSKEAESWGVKTLSLARRVLGQNHHETLSAGSKLAAVYTQQRRFKEAKELMAVDPDPKSQEDEQYHSLLAASDLGAISKSEGNLDEAEKVYTQAIDASLETLGEEHRVILGMKAHLAGVYTAQHRCGEAEEILMKVSSSLATQLGPNHERTLEALYILAECYAAQERMPEAEKLALHIIAVASRQYGHRHIAFSETSLMVSTWYRKQGRLDEAEKLLSQILQGSIQGEAGHVESKALRALIAIYKQQGRLSEVQELEGDDVENESQTHTELPPSTATNVNAISPQGPSQERPTMTSSLEMLVAQLDPRALSDEQPSSKDLISMTTIASTHRALGHWAKAERLYLRVIGAIGRSETHSMTDKPDLSQIFLDLSIVYLTQEKYEHAEAVLEEALDFSCTLEKSSKVEMVVKGTNLTLQILGTIAKMYHASARLIEAKTLIDEVVAGSNRVFGNMHPFTLEVTRLRRNWNFNDDEHQRESMILNGVQYDLVHPLHAASYRGQVKTVKELLEQGADIHEQSGHCGHALQAASLGGQFETPRVLLEKGADVNAQGGYYGNALQAAASQGHLEIARLLLDHGADVTAHGGRYGSALQAASYENHLAMASLLLNRISTSDAVQAAEEALHVASFRGNEEIVRLLLDYGADVNTPRGHHGTALRAAASEGHYEVVQLLLAKHADVNRQTSHSSTALQAATSKNHIHVVKLLLDHGADVNAQGGFYGTALHAACAEGHLAAARILLVAGADSNAPTGGGGGGHYATALDAAAHNVHPKITALLLSHGATPHSTPSSSPPPARGNFAASSAGMHLSPDTSLLIAECRDCAGRSCCASIDLNHCLANVDGTFRWQMAGDFAANDGARAVYLTGDGQYLAAELRTREGGWVAARVWLSERITNCNGKLEMVND